MISIALYFLWRKGYNSLNLKISMFISTFFTVCLYFFNLSNLIYISDTLNDLLIKVVFFLLLFYSIIFLIIVFSVPNPPNETVKNETNLEKDYLNNNTKSNVEKNTQPLTNEEIKLFKANSVKENNEQRKDTDKNRSFEEFQKFINDLYKNQKSKY